MGVPTLGCHCRVCQSRRIPTTIARALRCCSRATASTSSSTRPPISAFRRCATSSTAWTPSSTRTRHADHILGFDDIRPFNLRQKAALPVYASAETLAILRRTFAYVFDGEPVVSTIPGVILHVIEGPFELLGTPWKPIPAEHGDMQVLGFRVGGMAYLTDFSRVPAESKPLLDGRRRSGDRRAARRAAPHAPDRGASAGAGRRTAAAPRLVHAHRARSAAPGDQRAPGARGFPQRAAGLRRT